MSAIPTGRYIILVKTNDEPWTYFYGDQGTTFWSMTYTTADLPTYSHHIALGLAKSLSDRFSIDPPYTRKFRIAELKAHL